MKSSVFPPEKQLHPVLAVNSMSTSDNEQAQLLDHESSEQVLLPVEPKSRSRASAVVLGLALSMGTSSLLLPPQAKKVLAADSLTQNALLSLEEAASEAPIVTPSPIASPIPSSLELALNQASINSAVAPAGYNSVLKAGDDLLNLSKASLATPTPLAAVPTPNGTPTPTVTVAATLLPQATFTPESLPTVSPSPVLVNPESVAVSTLPGFALPLSDAAHATPAAESTVSLATPSSTSQPSPTSTIVAPTPTPTVVVTPQVSLPTPQVTVSSTPGIENPTRLDFASQAISVANGAEISVLPQLKQLSAERSAVKLAAVPAQADSSADSTGLNVASSLTPSEPRLITQLPEIQAITALREPNESIANPSVAESFNSADPLVTVAYRVNRGDTLNVIARQYGVSVAELIAANNITNPNQIEVNQEIRIPQTSRIRINTSVLRSSASTIPGESVATIAASGLNPETRLSPNVVSGTTVTSTSVNPYIQNLQAEIEELRIKFQKQSRQLKSLTPDGNTNAQPVATTTVAAASLQPAPLPVPVPAAPRQPVVTARVSEPVNPEFLTVSSGSRRSQPPTRPVWQGQRAAVQPSLPLQPIAVAPLAPAAYAPTIEAPRGQSVSPELPPLAAANTYLPSDLPQSKGYIWPAKGVMTSGYGWRWGRMHRGVDIAAPTGTPILAAATGVVEYAQWNSGGYGYLVDIRHPDGSLTRYGHNNRLLVREGQRVQQGQLIAEMGSTGFSTGPHCHFEIHAAGQGPVNPIAYLPQNRG